MPGEHRVLPHPFAAFLRIAMAPGKSVARYFSDARFRAALAAPSGSSALADDPRARRRAREEPAVLERLRDMTAIASPALRRSDPPLTVPRVSARAVALVAAVCLLLGAGFTIALALATPAGPPTRSLQPTATSPTPN